MDEGSMTEDKPNTISGSLQEDNDRVHGTIMVFSKPPDDHEIYNLIGRVASEWSHLEYLLDQTIWEAARLTQHEGHCITGQIVGPTPRLYALIALLLFHKVDAKLVERAREFAGQFSPTYEKRNRIVHDPWYTQVSTDDVYQYKGMARGELAKKDTTNLNLGIQVTLNVDEARELIESIKRKAARVAAFRNDVVKAMRGS
jgi:hypothetical protein